VSVLPGLRKIENLVNFEGVVRIRPLEVSTMTHSTDTETTATTLTTWENLIKQHGPCNTDLLLKSKTYFARWKKRRGKHKDQGILDLIAVGRARMAFEALAKQQRPQAADGNPMSKEQFDRNFLLFDSTWVRCGVRLAKVVDARLGRDESILPEAWHGVGPQDVRTKFLRDEEVRVGLRKKKPIKPEKSPIEVQVDRIRREVVKLRELDEKAAEALLLELVGGNTAEDSQGDITEVVSPSEVITSPDDPKTPIRTPRYWNGPTTWDGLDLSDLMQQVLALPMYSKLRPPGVSVVDHEKPLTSRFGYCDAHSGYIQIDVWEGQEAEEAGQTLIHEMVHALVGSREGHGPKFKERLVQTMKALFPACHAPEGIEKRATYQIDHWGSTVLGISVGTIKETAVPPVIIERVPGSRRSVVLYLKRDGHHHVAAENLSRPEQQSLELPGLLASWFPSGAWVDLTPKEARE
jgi:hypothetical protein